jgi:hypothetical protein
MTTEEKLELIAAIVEARERTKFGLQNYHELRKRLVMLDYDLGNKVEREVINIFYEKIEDADLGPLMEKTAADSEQLFKDVVELCGQNSLPEIDFEFSEILMRFVDLIENWRPLSEACDKIAKQLMTKLSEE